MLPIRYFVVRGSIILNAILVIYLCLSWSSFVPSRKILGASGQLLFRKTLVSETDFNRNSMEERTIATPNNKTDDAIKSQNSPLELPPVVDSRNEPIDIERSNSLEEKMFSDLKDCPTKSSQRYDTQRGEDYWILNNYIAAAKSFRCDESITYATHGDYTFLGNLNPVTDRWQVSQCRGV